MDRYCNRFTSWPSRIVYVMHNVLLDANKLTHMVDCVKGRRVRLTRFSWLVARVVNPTTGLSRRTTHVRCSSRTNACKRVFAVVRFFKTVINDRVRDVLCAMRVVQPVGRCSVLFVCTCYESCLPVFDIDNVNLNRMSRKNDQRSKDDDVCRCE